MKKLFSILALVILMGFGSLVVAGDLNDKVGTSAFPFLKIGMGARAVSMGGAFTGLANDESALYYNPAGIYSYDLHRYIFGYHNYFDDMQSGVVGYIRSQGNELFIGGYISYLNYGKFIETNGLGEILGEFSGSDIVFAVTAAKRLGKNLNYSVGATGKLIVESLQDSSAAGLAIDLGVKYSGDRDKMSFGLAIQNLGTQLSSLGEEKYSLPLTVRVGGAVIPRGLPVQFVSDLVLPRDNDLYVAMGAEFFSLKPLYIRMGWNSFGSNFRAVESDDKSAGLSFGLGFDYEDLMFSYSFAPAAELGDTHRITITGHFKP